MAGLASITKAPRGGSTVLLLIWITLSSDQIVFSAKLCSETRVSQVRLRKHIVVYQWRHTVACGTTSLIDLFRLHF